MGNVLGGGRASPRDFEKIWRFEKRNKKINWKS